MEFTVYDDTTGRVLRTGYCPDNQFEYQAGEHSIVEGVYADDQFYWDNGFHHIPLKPEGFYNFDYSKKEWVLDVDRTINTNKDKRNKMLQGSDWTQLPDVALTQVEKEAWAVYRQQLRNMTEQDYLDGNFPIY